MQHDAIDADFGAEALVHFFHREAHLLAIEDVHAQQHFGPVVGFCAADACADRDEAVAEVVGVAQQRLEFDFFDALNEAKESGVGFFQKIVIARLFRHFVADFGVFEVPDRSRERLDLGFEEFGFGDDLFGGGLVVPE